MARAFRSGIEAKRKLNMPLKQRRWPTVESVLRPLKVRANATASSMGPMVEVPSLVRIENERWVFERIEQSTLDAMWHRLVLTSDGGETIIGVTKTLDTALMVAQRMAEQEDSIVLIQSL